MATSPEYPDLTWVAPRSWTNANRTAVQLIVIHTTEGSSHAGSAEDGAAYDARRTDGTSSHYFHDGDSTVQCVRTEDQAHTARSQGNRRGIQHELCAKAGFTAAQWSSDYSLAMLQRAARQCARDAKKWGIPVRHLTAAQVAAGDKGFCGHWDISRAFPQDKGSHTDPGPNFPWTVFLNMVRDELEDDVLTPKEIDAVADATVAKMMAYRVPLTRKPDGAPDETWRTDSAIGYAADIGRQNRTRLSELATAAGADATRDAELQRKLAELPGVIRAELESTGGTDAVLAEAAVTRALARLRLTVEPT